MDEVSVCIPARLYSNTGGVYIPVLSHRPKTFWDVIPCQTNHAAGWIKAPLPFSSGQCSSVEFMQFHSVLFSSIQFMRSVQSV